MSVVVTGGAGFIGSRVAECFARRGEEVFVVDNFDPFYPADAKRRNLKSVLEAGKVTFIERDVRDTRFLLERIDVPVDGVVHLAASAGVRPSVERPRWYIENNIDGTQAVLDFCVERRIRRLVFASSSSVYGNDTPRPARESAPADRPISPYAATKRAAELFCHAAHVLHHLDVSCVRLFTAIGPRQRPDLALYRFAKLLADDQPVTLFGDGSSERDYTYVGDIAEGIVRTYDRASGFRIYNLGAGRSVRLLDFVGEIGRAMGREPKIKFVSSQPGDVDATLADISLAQRELGYAPQYDYRYAIKEFVSWFSAAQ